MTLTINKKNAPLPVDAKRINQHYDRVSNHIQQAHQNIRRAVDTEMVKAYWLIGRDIVEDEQQGAHRAEYGKAVLTALSAKLQQHYHRGFSVDTLERARKFYLLYQLDSHEAPISATPLRKFIPVFKPNLSWSHYLLLIRVSDVHARAFYEIEASKNNWSFRELRRQIGSLLYDRLALSKDKEGLLKLAHDGQEISKPEDVLKEPVVLEFLDLPESHKLVESGLESAIIDKLQQFLLELGKGFAFVARQKRLTLDGKHYYTDLVMYHTILKCYIIIDLKTHTLTHADLGQMLLYVNYFDREYIMDDDNPTIGLVLCSERSDSMANYLLGDKAQQIFTRKYQFHLPSVDELSKKVSALKTALEMEMDLSNSSQNSD